MEFGVSKREMMRRRAAFLSLSVALTAGLVLGSIVMKIVIAGYIYMILTGLLIAANMWISKFFDIYIQTKICLDDKSIFRVRETNKEEFGLAKLSKIIIKRTKGNLIREMYLYFDDRQSMFINGIKKFRRFEIELLKRSSCKVLIEEIVEPIDFDSKLFYPILGVLISFGSLCFIKILINASFQIRMMVSVILVTYVLVVGIYLWLTKPISKRY